MKRMFAQRLRVGLIVGVAAVGLSGCTSYLTARDPTLVYDVTKTKENIPLSGFDYWLPRTQFDIAVEWKVVGCKADTGDLIIKMTPTVEQKTIKGEMYVIDPRDMQGLMRNGKITTEYGSDRFTKTINGESSDQTAEVAKSFITAASKIIVASTGVARGKGNASCGKAGLRLDTQKADGDKLKAAQGDLADAQEKVTRWTTIVEKKGAKATIRDIETLNGFRKALEKEVAKVAAAQKVMDGHGEYLSAAAKATWIPNLETEFPTVLAIDKDTADAWELSETVRMAQSVRIGLAIVRPTNAVVVKAASTTPVTFLSSIKGIPYRVPAEVTFQFCAPGLGNCGDQNPSDESVVKGVVPNKSAFQLGYPFVFPVEFQTFTTRSFVLEFDDNRILKKVSWEQTKSIGEGAGAVAGAAADAYTDVTKAKADAKMADEEAKKEAAGAETAALKLQADYLAAQISVAELTAKLAKPIANTTERDSLQAQLNQTTLEADLFKAQLDKLNAEVALAKAKTAAETN